MKKLDLNIQMFASTNKTTNYELPQFIGTDKPTWLGDFNEAMADIDAGMHANASDIDTLESSVATASATASQASQDVATLTSTVNTLSSDVSSATSTANNAQSTATSALNTANTANGKADTNATAITGLDTRVTALEGASDTYSTNEVETNMVWIDGKKIYRKTFAGNLNSSINHGLSNVHFVNAYGFYESGTGSFVPLPDVRPTNAQFNVGFYITSTQIVWDKGTGVSGNATITLEYTKSS